MSDYPRLLVATEYSPNSPGGGGSGAVLRQMLKDWPPEKLFWWSCLPEHNGFFGQKVAAHRVALLPKKLYPNRRFRAQKSWLLEKWWVPRAARHFRKTLDLFQPSVVWAHPHCWAIPPLARALPGAGVGFHISLHDYADVNGNIARIGKYFCAQLVALADELYAAATTRDAICRAMVDDLHVRTGCDGSISRAGLEQEDFNYLARTPGTSNGQIRIAYPGTVIVEKEFALFVKALAQIRDRLPLPATLEFFGDHSYRSRPWFDSAWMKENGSLPAAELSRALKDCSWGFSPMALTDDNPRYNRFSLPTKFAGSIAAGLPVITLGHPESTVVKMASQYQVGLCLTDGNLEKLSAQLFEGLSEPDAKKKYRAEIQRCALAEFDVRRMRAILYENFRKCASASVSGHAA
jgi:glycosyltransferase involved in cell wall biosynthesis